MKNIGTTWRIIIAIASFLIFGCISIMIGTFDWQDVFQTALLGVIAVFVVFNYE